MSNLKFTKPRNSTERQIDVKSVEFITEFSDGTFLVTNNAKGLNPIEEVKGFIAQQYPPETPIKTLLDHHVDKCKQLCAEGNLKTYIIATKDVWFASACREHVTMAKGFITDDEFRRIVTGENR